MWTIRINETIYGFTDHSEAWSFGCYWHVEKTIQFASMFPPVDYNLKFLNP